MKPVTKVCIVNNKSDCDFTVFFVDTESKQSNHSIICPGQLVKKESDAHFKLYIVDKESKALICILRKNFPRQL
jgi:hypothetical protein